MVWYYERMRMVDGILRIFTEDPYWKWVLLSTFHYGLVVIIMGILMFATRTYFFLAVGFVILVCLCNFIDNGCLLLKLERQYIGKHWYGPYNLIDYVCPGSLNQINVDLMYGIVVLCIGCIILFRLATLEP
jgi:hypothetical protein